MTNSIPGHLNLITAQKWLSNQRPPKIEQVTQNKTIGKLSSIGLFILTVFTISILISKEKLLDISVFLTGSLILITPGIIAIKEFDRRAVAKRQGLSNKLTKSLKENPDHTIQIKSVLGQIQSLKRKGVEV